GRGKQPEVTDAVARQILPRRHSGHEECSLVESHRVSHLAAKVIGNKKQQHAVADVVLAHTMDESVRSDRSAMHCNLTPFSKRATSRMPQLPDGDQFWLLPFDGALD